MDAAVFIDYQNIYRTAREAFGWQNEPGQFGNFRPLSLARLLTREADRDLVAVHVYTGVPVPDRDSRGHGAMQRRTQAWVADDPNLVHLHTRSLRYPPPQGREKGVDVELAIDFVRLALDDAYELAILASADTDLVPALEFVSQRCQGKQIETVSLDPLPGHEAAAPIDIPGGGLARRLITKQEFERLADRTNYLRASHPRDGGQLPGQSGRRLPPGRRS